jgi:hypothetical protein
MKTKILLTTLIIFPFVLTTCINEAVNLNLNECQTNCFTIKGTFRDSIRDTPVGNLPIELRHKSLSIGSIIPYNRQLGKTTTSENGTFTISIDPIKYNDDNHLFELNVLSEHYALANTIPYLSVINDPRFIFYCDSSLIDSTAIIEVQLIPKSYATINVNFWPSNVKIMTILQTGPLGSFSHKFSSIEPFPFTMPIAAYLKSELQITIETDQAPTTRTEKLASKGIGETQVLEIGF